MENPYNYRNKGKYAFKNGKMGYKFVFPQTTPQGSLFYIDNINLIKLR